MARAASFSASFIRYRALVLVQIHHSQRFDDALAHLLAQPRIRSQSKRHVRSNRGHDDPRPDETHACAPGVPSPKSGRQSANARSIVLFPHPFGPSSMKSLPLGTRSVAPRSVDGAGAVGGGEFDVRVENPMPHGERSGRRRRSRTRGRGDAVRAFATVASTRARGRATRTTRARGGATPRVMM